MGLRRHLPDISAASHTWACSPGVGAPFPPSLGAPHRRSFLGKTNSSPLGSELSWREEERAGGLPQACPHCWPAARGLQASTPPSQGPGAHCQGSTCCLKRLSEVSGGIRSGLSLGHSLRDNRSSESLLSLHTGQGSSYFLFCFHPPHHHRPRALKAKKGFSFSLEKCSWKASRRKVQSSNPTRRLPWRDVLAARRVCAAGRGGDSISWGTL